jgi:hypothetical protein
MEIRVELRRIAERYDQFKARIRKEPEQNEIERIATFDEFVKKVLETRPSLIYVQTKHARTDGFSITGFMLSGPGKDCIVTEYEIPGDKTGANYLYTEMYTDDKGNPITLDKMSIVEGAQFTGSCELTAMERMETFNEEFYQRTSMQDEATDETRINMFYTGAHYSCPTLLDESTKDGLKRIMSCNGRSQPHPHVIPARFNLAPWPIKI